LVTVSEIQTAPSRLTLAPRIWTGIAAPVAVVSGLLLVIAGGSAWYIRDMQQSVANMLAENLTSLRAAQELELSVRDLRAQVDLYLITGVSKHLESVPRLRDRATAALTSAEAAALTPGEQAVMRRTRAGLETFFDEYERMTRGNPDRADFARTLNLIDSVLTKEVLDPTREYLRLNEGMLTKANEENQRLADRLTFGLLSLGLCGAVGGLLGGWVISSAHRRTMLRTEEQLRQTARQLDEAARSAEDAADRGGRTVSALDDVAKSAAAVVGRLRQTEQEALRAEQLAWAGQMAAGVAHEIRNPLMAIKLLVQALADGRRGERFQARDLKVLDEEIVRLEQVTTSFLDFARPPQPDKSPCDVVALAERVASGVRERARLQGVTLDVQTPPQSVVVEADPNQLRQLLYNLAYNALDAQPAGGRVVIVVDDEKGPSPDGAPVAIRVEDDGPGLPPRLAERIFEPFVSTKEAGMGLGLSICRRIVESHGGQLLATTGPEGGAVFTVRLPRGMPPGVRPADNSDTDGAPEGHDVKAPCGR
jgi:signal transduction histidine kinase